MYSIYRRAHRIKLLSWIVTLVAAAIAASFIAFYFGRASTPVPDRKAMEREAIDAVGSYYRSSIMELEKQTEEDSATIASLKYALEAARRERDEAVEAKRLSGRGARRSIAREVIVTAIQFECAKQGINPQPVVEIVERESGFDPYAVNPTSGAEGLFQRHPPGQVVLGDVEGQIANGVAYIKNRYGTSEAALAWWDANGSY